MIRIIKGNFTEKLNHEDNPTHPCSSPKLGLPTAVRSAPLTVAMRHPVRRRAASCIRVPLAAKIQREREREGMERRREIDRGKERLRE